jgi:hypothetical protein
VSLVVGLLLRTPEVLNDSQEGAPLINQVFGANPSETDRVWLNLLFFVPLGSDVVVIVGLATTVSVTALLVLPLSLSSPQ